MNSETYLVNKRRRVFGTGAIPGVCCCALSPGPAAPDSGAERLKKSRILIPTTVPDPVYVVSWAGLHFRLIRSPHCGGEPHRRTSTPRSRRLVRYKVANKSAAICPSRDCAAEQTTGPWERSESF